MRNDFTEMMPSVGKKLYTLLVKTVIKPLSYSIFCREMSMIWAQDCNYGYSLHLT